MKKGILLFVTLCMMGLTVGCGGTATSSEEQGSSKIAEGTTDEKVGEVKKVGIVQYMEHPSLDEIKESTVAELEKQGFVDGQNIEIEFQSAQGDQANLNTIASQFIGDNVDVIIAIATPAAQAMASATSDIPIIFSAVSDPVGAKLMVDMNAPSANITGTSDAIPTEEIFELCKELTPDVQKIGFLYSASEANSQSAIDLAKEKAADYGYTYEEATITATSELQQVAQVLAGKVDAIYTPTDNNIAGAMPVLSEIGKEAGIPVYVGADSMVKDGGYATIGVNYTDLGVKTGEMVAKVLNGTSVSEIPAETLDEFSKVINKTTANAIGATADAEGATIVE